MFVDGGWLSVVFYSQQLTTNNGQLTIPLCKIKEPFVCLQFFSDLPVCSIFLFPG